jgi:hypothetical protein
MMTIAPTHQTMLFTVCSSQPMESADAGSGTWTTTAFEEADRNSQQDDVGGASSSQSNTGRDG